jgi:hypothetical protein
MSKIIIATGLVSLWAFASAHATNVLFIDLNNAEDEVSAVAEALPARDTHLVVVPPLSRFSEAQREEILQVKQSFEETRRLAERCTLGGTPPCPVIWEKLRTLELERERLTGAYDINALIDDLRPHRGTVFDIVIISGHHSKGYFRGEIAQLEIDDLTQIDAQFPNAFRAARTALLLGCETGTPDMLRGTFSHLFPSARVLIGAEDNAPTRSEARNLKFIDSVIKSEPALQRLKTVKTVGRMHAKWVRAKWPATLLWRREHFFAKRWNGPVADAAQGVLAADLAEADRRAASARKARAAQAHAVLRTARSVYAP